MSTRVVPVRPAIRTRNWIAAAVTVTMLICFVAATAVRDIEGWTALIVLIFQLPLFVPTAIYYRFVKGQKAVLVCGVLLLALSIPAAVSTVILDPPPYFWMGAAFFLTLITSIVGAVAGRSRGDRLTA